MAKKHTQSGARPASASLDIDRRTLLGILLAGAAAAPVHPLFAQAAASGAAAAPPCPADWTNILNRPLLFQLVADLVRNDARGKQLRQQFVSNPIPTIKQYGLENDPAALVALFQLKTTTIGPYLTNETQEWLKAFAGYELPADEETDYDDDGAEDPDSKCVQEIDTDYPYADPRIRRIVPKKGGELRIFGQSFPGKLDPSKDSVAVTILDPANNRTPADSVKITGTFRSSKVTAQFSAVSTSVDYTLELLVKFSAGGKTCSFVIPSPPGCTFKFPA